MCSLLDVPDVLNDTKTRNKLELRNYSKKEMGLNIKDLLSVFKAEDLMKTAVTLQKKRGSETL